ncbi:transcriptional regulator, MarR family [Sanguibacter keddieii DSM 10542]|uniref:Transcriptional regulator, MarR family n=1 Tax=Sanguibacter keddieii (strain ATCC 51767 / DSM 10542 / NCFB 3025 / ST-74) TaxID=446469 RepID=D1BAN1_SANKS|nr:MarR family transcriptional regulator [Sanguibacter keddieii]ACZ20582.1 transcriptional regulator, MarR family [Sanguibacter keddieii DSM 10542]
MTTQPLPTDPGLLLDAQLCFRLYRSERAVLATYRELLADLGVTYPQYLVLLVLWETDGATVSHLGSRLALESGTLSPLLRRMEDAGLVSRTRSGDDERVVHVRLTEAGRDLRERAHGVPQDLWQRGGLDAGETAELARLLDRLSSNLAGAEPARDPAIDAAFGPAAVRT